MWRVASTSDDEAAVSMCTALNAEDPGATLVPPEQVLATLAKLRAEPNRGRAVVCDVDGHTVGYALLISFWSNELGGEVCSIDELFVAHRYRGRGLATALLGSLVEGNPSLWPAKPAALALEVSLQNERALALYERLGFQGTNLSKRLPLST
jgi:ribosomal protein S18 acetylase RimI-like enzyme